jgi:hypothetical protein
MSHHPPQYERWRGASRTAAVTTPTTGCATPRAIKILPHGWFDALRCLKGLESRPAPRCPQPCVRPLDAATDMLQGTSFRHITNVTQVVRSKRRPYDISIDHCVFLLSRHSHWQLASGLWKDRRQLCSQHRTVDVLKPSEEESE